jgi:hypothetical protein
MRAVAAGLVQNELQAMSRYLLKHTVVLDHFEYSAEMKDRIDVLDWDKLSMYDLLQLAFVARETFVELESVNHFLRWALGYLLI